MILQYRALIDTRLLHVKKTAACHHVVETISRSFTLLK
nr:MAG TPA: hypothetical protein [Caudoviricetes sp.]